MWIQTSKDKHQDDNKTATLHRVSAPLWRASVKIDSQMYFAGYWFTSQEAITACEVYNRILSVKQTN